MQFRKTIALGSVLLSLAFTAQAQDAGLATGTPVTEDGDPIGQPYLAEEHGDWQRTVHPRGDRRRSLSALSTDP